MERAARSFFYRYHNKIGQKLEAFKFQPNFRLSLLLFSIPKSAQNRPNLSPTTSPVCLSQPLKTLQKVSSAGLPALPALAVGAGNGGVLWDVKPRRLVQPRRRSLRNSGRFFGPFCCFFFLFWDFVRLYF